MRTTTLSPRRYWDPHDLDALIARARGEFLEMPGLRLTAGQARRLWSLDSTVTEALLNALVGSGFLQQTRDGSYVRRAA